MKVELLVNLKTAEGRILVKGSVFDDSVRPIPKIIQRKLGTSMVRVYEDYKGKTFTTKDVPKPQEVMPLVTEDPVEEPVVETQVDEPVETQVEEPEVPEEPVEEVPERKRRYARRYTRKNKDDTDD